MKRMGIAFLIILALIQVFSQSQKISDNLRYIVNGDGAPFLWFGDTAWEFFHKLNREDATEYLTKIAEQDSQLFRQWSWQKMMV